MDVLRTDGITMQFGGVRAVSDLKLNIQEGEIVALIGPNGAGKTTVFNMVTGVYKPTSGNIFYTKETGKEVNITGKKPSDIAKLGIARTFQNIRLFKDLTVYENVLIAKHLHLKSDFLSATLHLPWYMKEKIMITKKKRGGRTAEIRKSVGYQGRKIIIPALWTTKTAGDSQSFGYQPESFASG